MSAVTKSRSLDMTKGDPAGLIIRFAIPMLLGGIFQLLYNMVDTIIVGRFVSTDALAAIGATSSFTAFVMFMSNSVTNALSVTGAQAEGSKDEVRLKKTVSHAFYLAVVTGVMMGILANILARPLMKLLGTDPAIIDDSVAYIRIASGLILVPMLYGGSSAVLRAIGDSKTPLYFLIFSSLLNVVLDLVFVLALGLGVPGVAIATVISQGVSSILCITYMLKKYPRLRPDKASWVYDKRLIRELLSIAVPLCLQSAVLNVGMFVITAVINSFGKDTMAAYTIGGRVEQLATVSFSNIAFSFSVYTGQNFGARTYGRIKEGLRKGIVIVLSLAALSSLVMLFFARPLALIFMDEVNETVLTRAVQMIRTEASMFVMLGTIWTLNSSLRGMGVIKITLVSSVVELVSKIGFSLLLPRFLGVMGIWLAAPLGWALGILPPLFFLLWWLKDPEGRLKDLNRFTTTKAK